MDGDDGPIFGGGLRQSDDPAIEQSGILGARRRWTNINQFEILFLILAILGTIASDGLTIYRLATNSNHDDPDFVYAVLILINSVFLLIFLVTGIFQQRITDIVAFIISAIMLTVYVVVHFILRPKEAGDREATEAKFRLARLICTATFNVLFIPLSIYVIRDYQRDEFAKRLFGAFPTARWPLKIYNIFDCVARIDTMFSISIAFLNLYNVNGLQASDQILIGIAVPLSLLWLGIGVGMIRLENRILVAVFYVISLFQPGFLIYCFYSAIAVPAFSTTMASPTFLLTSTSMTPLMDPITKFLIRMGLLSPGTLPIPVVIYVCVALNMFTHLFAMILGMICVRNFGKGLKERVFNNKLDKFFQERWSRT